uniref:Sodium-dependent transporter n=1 Tax=Branchiostoma floridae TaxID=7739 RepID=C3Y4N6_BRAFL|eukprot:XP_002608683.1 hypothetical protein BRAFLDRAFT_73905 [Branchiostoma floridae]
MADDGVSEEAQLVENDTDSSGSDTDSETSPQEASGGAAMFSSKAGLLLTFISAVGGGSLWRFPRILANNCGEQGCLQFLLVWLVFLFLWSIPLIIIEVAIGRFTRRAPPMAFQDLLGESNWPVLLQFVITVACAAANWRGVGSIELAMTAMTPLLLVLLLTALIWALTLNNAGVGLGFFCTPDWGTSMTHKMGPVKNVIWTTATNGTVRLPILFSTMTGGRVMASLFFLAVVIATFSNYITLMNTSVQAMVDWGVKRSVAVGVIATLTFLLGIPSAVNINVLVNQDFVWSAGLIFSGLSMIYLLWRYGAKNFRLDMLNEVGDGSDWKLPNVFDYLTKYVLLLNGLVLLVW